MPQIILSVTDHILGHIQGQKTEKKPVSDIHIPDLVLVNLFNNSYWFWP